MSDFVPFADDDLRRVSEVCSRARRLVVVADSNVDRLYGDAVVKRLAATGLAVERIVFPAGERSKTLETYCELVRGFAALGLSRSDAALALGGGVVGDLTGFAAATYMRGIDFIQAPTSLLAMVDSSIGGKTGVDIPEGKNLVGAFHLPKAILRDCRFLATLPARELKNGYAEMIKTAILFDAELFAVLGRLSSKEAPPAELVEKCAAWKERVVTEDFREGGRRKLLNLGHTFGHAIEKVSNFAIPHGEAVAMGMRIVSTAVPAVGNILDRFGFEGYDGSRIDEVIAAIAADKKVSGDDVDLIVPRAVGDCAICPTPLSQMTDFWYNYKHVQQ